MKVIKYNNIRKRINYILSLKVNEFMSSKTFIFKITLCWHESNYLRKSKRYVIKKELCMYVM